MQDKIKKLALRYHRDVHAAAKASVSGEEEAQLTVPVSNLLSDLVSLHNLGELKLIRETRLEGSRPDFAAILTRSGKTVQKGHVELKSPSVSIDVTTWSGRNAKQWDRMKAEAEILLVCNGRLAQIYRDGAVVGEPVTLPYDDPEDWNAENLVQLLSRFIDLTPSPITSVTDLSKRLAIRTADLRDRLIWLLERDDAAGEAAKGAYQSWKQHIDPHASSKNFADGIAQVIAYGMAMAMLSVEGADKDGDGHVSVAEARTAIRGFSPVLAAAFAPLVDKPILADAVQVELGALETLVSAINPKRVNQSADRRGDPWLYFYEDFLSVYDAEARRQAGVYYTPIDVVSAMTAITEYLLVNRFQKRLGFADANVVTLDPATGTGTFPLAVIDRGVDRAVKARGPAGKQQAAISLSNNLFAFELLPGPYSVAHLRLSSRLRLLSDGKANVAQVLLTDTLESPLDAADYQGYFGDAEILAAEHARAKRIKLDQRVTVVIGNPPYRRVARDVRGRGTGGWVLNGLVPGRNSEKSLFDDVLDVARELTIFSHHASLYNLYVYFWRWAIWKAFQAHGDGPGIVSFITGSSWLTGPGFVGLRKLVREMCDEVWVIDLGGDNHGANPEENIFAIESPVAVVILVRNGNTKKDQPATIHYRRVSGGADEKLVAMRTLAEAENPLGGDWLEAPCGWIESFVPETGDASWTDMPLLTDLFPWQQPGCKFGRTWPIGTTQEVLESRWEKFTSAKSEDKPDLFFTATSGRTIQTKVDGHVLLSETKTGDPSQPIVRYAFRSFDRQWTFNDPRLAALERPSLWKGHSNRQLFLTSLLTAQISDGPAITAAAYVPDLHHYRGSFGGKDIIPLWRDAAATQPNMTKGLGAVIGKSLGIVAPDVEELAAYVYALLSARAYQRRFAVALQTPGLRVPITANANLWNEAVAAGRELIWLHSFAERFGDDAVGRGAEVPLVNGVEWLESVTKLPENMADIKYDGETGYLNIGDGVVSGVRPDVWSYQVSGMVVMRKWLGYRTRKGTGKAASSSSDLDKIRPTGWADDWNDELLDLIRVLTITQDRQPVLEDLLDRICSEALLETALLPLPDVKERSVPK
jgi:Type ISP C-terminal specificity domain/N-6 DNA Methylase